MSDHSFSEPRRQAPLGVLILFGENVVKLFRIVAAIVFASIYTQSLPLSTGSIVGIGAALMAIYTVLQHRRFRFHISNDELILHRGVLQRERVAIPLERIQTVHLSQNLLQQVMLLTGLKIDTAGSGKEEIKISALTRSDAEALQILLEGHSVQAESIIESDSIATEEVKRSPLVSLSFARLLLVGLTENHIRSGFIALGVVWGYAYQFEDLIREYLGNQTTWTAEEVEAATTGGNYGLQFILWMILFFLVISVLVSLTRTVLRHFGLEASLAANNIRVSSGLLKRNVYTIPLSKIQMMTWKGNVLRNIPGFESLVIKQSKSDDNQRKLNVEIPACYADQTTLLEENLYGASLGKEFTEYRPHPYFRVLLSIIFSLLIGLPFLIASISAASIWLSLGYVPAVLIVVLWVNKYYNRMRLGTNGEVLVAKKGWLFTSRTMLAAYKIQSMKMSQSIFQKRSGTAHLTLYTAGGTMRFNFMPERLVHELHNYLLYKVEMSKESWM